MAGIDSSEKISLDILASRLAREYAVPGANRKVAGIVYRHGLGVCGGGFCGIAVRASEVRRTPWGLWRALRLEPSKQPISGGLRRRLRSLLHLPEWIYRAMGGHHGRRTPLAISSRGRKRYCWQHARPIPGFLLGVFPRLGGAIPHQPMVRNSSSQPKPGVGAVGSTKFLLRDCGFPLGIGLHALLVEQETANLDTGIPACTWD
jgi:hypothetical protein